MCSRHTVRSRTRRLFNKAAWHTAKDILNLIQNGYLSDPPGIALYYTIGTDAKAGNLPLYRCVRGTNWTEGGVHRHLRPKLPTSGTSPRQCYAVSMTSFFAITCW